MNERLHHFHNVPRLAVNSAIIAGAGVLGCRQVPAPRASHVMVEGGEVRVVDNTSIDRAKNIWRSDSLPSLAMGDGIPEPLTELNPHQPHAVVQLNNGRVVVSDGTRLLVLSDDGTLLRVAGREGSGPGEFRQIRTLCGTQGDTIVVGDEGNHRIVILDADGRFVRIIPQEYGGPFDDACLSDGTFLVQAVRADQRDGKYPAIEVSRLRLDGTEAKYLGNLSFEGVDRLQYHGEVVSARGKRFVVSEAKESEVRVFDPDGTNRLTVRTADAPKSISERAVRGLIQATIPTNVSPDEARVRIARSESRPHRLTRPAFERCMLDDLGGTWLLMVREKPGAPESWVHFDSSGKLTGRLTLDEGRRSLRTMRFGRETIWLQSRDEDGVVKIASYRLVRIGQADTPGRSIAR